jgi:uncharacterized delta-60 repeat protein
VRVGNLDRVLSGTVDPAGRPLVLVVTRHGRTESLVVLRYTTGGRPDRSFGQGGRVVVGEGDPLIHGVGLVASAGGRITVLATRDADTGRRTFAWRLTSHGRPDGSFGVGGMAVIPMTVAGVAGRGHAVYVTGWVPVDPASGRMSLAVGRLDDSGRLAGYFAGTGLAEPLAGLTGTSFGFRLSIARDGRIVVVGERIAEDRELSVVARLRGSGAPDTSFATGGVLQIPARSGRRFALGVTATDGGILLSGRGSGPRPRSTAVVRLRRDGRLDRDFGIRGVAPVPGQSCGDVFELTDRSPALACRRGLVHLDPRGAQDRMLPLPDGFLSFQDARRGRPIYAVWVRYTSRGPAVMVERIRLRGARGTS